MPNLNIPALTELLGSIPTDVKTKFEGNVIPMTFLCSDKQSERSGNLMTAPALIVELSSVNNGQIVCSFTDNGSIKNEILGNKTLSMASIESRCPPLANGKYSLRLRSSAKPQAALAQTFLGKCPMWRRSAARVKVLTDQNPNRDGKEDTPGVLTEEQCDFMASPLVVHLNNSNINSRDPLVLSSQQNGIMFDILGANAEPTPYSKKRISWQQQSQPYYYIVLPDAQGQVKGIDQMFGDNTLGPDGKFALNGYEALAKYDSNKDKRITSLDPIYSKLRMWRDHNRDGVSQASELYSLPQLGVSVVDLRYDSSFYEVDRYGNETRYKSVVQTKDGRLHLLFDLWFKYQ